MAANTKVITGQVRLAYPSLFEPREFNGDLSYQVQILIPKADEATVKKIKNAMQTAAVSKFGASTKMDQLKSTLRDGDAENQGEAYVGHYFMSVKSRDKPGVIDRNNNPVIDPNEVRSGDYARVSISAFAYNNSVGGKGVSCGLQNVQWLSTGEPIGNRARPEDDFEGAWEEPAGTAADPW